MRKIVAIMAILAVLSILSGNLYGMYAYVSEIDTENDMVRFTSYLSEHDFWWEGCGNLELYDDAELVMFDWFTESWEDDQIINVKYFRFPLPEENMKGAN